MTELALYDQQGSPVAYLVNDGAIYTWRGKAVAYVDTERIFGWKGRHIGWFVDGVVFDNHGKRVGYTRERCPVVTKVSPVKSVKSVRHVKSVRNVPRVRPVLSLGKSSTPLADFLTQNS